MRASGTAPTRRRVDLDGPVGAPGGVREVMEESAPAGPANGAAAGIFVRERPGDDAGTVMRVPRSGPRRDKAYVLSGMSFATSALGGSPPRGRCFL
jgi:hypothetical protein